MIDIFVQWLLFSTICIDAILAWFLLFKNFKSPVHQAYWMMMGAIALWQITNFISAYHTFTSVYSAQIILHSTFLAAGITVYLAWYFTTLFPRGKHDKKKLLFISILWGILGTIIMKTNWLVELVEYRGTGQNIHSYNWFYAIFISIIFIGIFHTFFTLQKKYKLAASQREKTQIQYLIVGFIIFFSIGLFTNSFIPIFTNILLDVPLNNSEYIYIIGPSSTVIFSLLVAYAILRHRLLDMRIILQRKWFISIIAILLSGIFLCIIAVSFQSLPTFLFYSIAMIALFFPLQKGIALVITKMLKKQTIDLFKITDIEKQFLATCNTPESLFERFSKEIMETTPLHTLQCITYDPLSQHYRTALSIGSFKKMGTDFDYETEWIHILRKYPFIFIPDNSIETTMLYPPKERAKINDFCKEKNIHAIIPLYNDELLGIYVLGAPVEKEKSITMELNYFQALQEMGNYMIRPVLTLYHAVMTRIDDSTQVEKLLKKNTLLQQQK